MELTTEFINSLIKDNEEKQYNVYNNSLPSISRKWNTISSNPFLFNNEIENDFKITDQKSSGRCWLFATLNLVRFAAASKWSTIMDTKELEFSQSYLYFWDKFERYNRYLNYFLKVNELPLEVKNYYLVALSKDPLGDGGQWDMGKELLLKYGVVPKYVYPDSFHARNSSGMNNILTEMLKQDWIKLSELQYNVDCKDILQDIISKMMAKVYNVLVQFLGKPPTKFNYEFKYKNKVTTWDNLTPQSLLEKTEFKPDEWVSLVNDPRKENIYNKYYQVEYLGNIKNQHVGWLNIPIERMKELTRESININYPVWFGCDVGKHRDKDSGIHDLDIIDYSKTLGINIEMTKEQRLRLYHSVPSHAMLITGYNKDSNIHGVDNYVNNINRWKVENSWGSSSGHNGYLMMTDRWFDQYVYQIVVNIHLLKEGEVKEFDNIYKVLPPWDPLGTLA